MKNLFASIRHGLNELFDEPNDTMLWYYIDEELSRETHARRRRQYSEYVDRSPRQDTDRHHARAGVRKSALRPR